MTLTRKTAAVILFSLFCAAVLSAAPQVAVLNAVLALGIDPTVAVPVTDRIIEELLNSGRFTVIDRANVEQILREKEFQLSSGIVRNEEVRQAGEYLGADFVILPSVSRVGSTYVITAKMIDVVSGEIAAQSSAEKQGKIDVLLEIARLVGKQISGQQIAVVPTTAAKKEPDVAGKAAAEAAVKAALPSPMAVAQVQELIRLRTHMRRGGVVQIQGLAGSLSDQDRMFLYTSNRKDNAVTALLLNLLLTSLGSWLQGDVSGALTELTLALSGVAAIAGGVDYDPYWDEYYYTGLYYAGVVILALDAVYLCVRPFRFVRLWNQNLAMALNLPYISILDPQESSYAVVPALQGPDWRFGLSLVSIRY